MALTPDTIAELNALAAEIFAAAYPGSPAEAYARSRGFTPETTGHWRFGYAVPSATNLLDRLGAAGWPEGTLVEAGLCRPSERGTIDLFRDRLLFPILDRDGVRILGFGSRRLRDDDKSVPKYVNSPATPLFAKNETLYGWPNMADIIAAGEAIVVEGEGGAIRTADLGYLEPDGMLVFVARKDDTINVSGLNVYPGEVEDVVMALPGVTLSLIHI